MLRRFRMFRTPRLRVPWWLPPVFPWAVVAGFAWLGASITDDCRLIAAAGGLTALMLASIRRQMLRHQSRHRRRERQHDVMVSVTRAVYECEGRTPPPGLDDDRERRPGAEVVQLRPRGGAPRHSRSRRTGA